MKRRLVDYARQFEVSAFVPPQALQAAADERTQNLVNYFRVASQHLSPQGYQRAIETLARSCYIQGAQDTALVAAQMCARKAAQAGE